MSNLILQNEANKLLKTKERKIERLQKALSRGQLSEKSRYLHEKAASYAFFCDFWGFSAIFHVIHY